MDRNLTSTRRRLNGVALHVVEAGPPDGPLAILLHGFPDAWWTWQRQIGPLAEAGYRVIAPTLRGYHLSSKPERLAAYALDVLVGDVTGLADAYGRDRFRLVGHDWGGVVAWWTAVRHPERVERLVVVDAPHPDVWAGVARRHPTQALRSTYVGFFQLPWVPEALLRANDFALMRRALLRTSRPGAFTADDLRRYREAWGEPGALTAMINYYRALRLRPASDAAHRIRPPALVVWGGRDAFLERPMFEASLALCDRGEALFLEDATHWVHREEAEAVNAALLRFLAG